MKTHTEYLRYTFTRAEQDATIKSQIEGEISQSKRYSDYLNNGFDYRDVVCHVILDCPAKGQKTIVRIRDDNNTDVRTVAMTYEDRQEALRFEGAE